MQLSVNPTQKEFWIRCYELDAANNCAMLLQFEVVQRPRPSTNAAKP